MSLGLSIGGDSIMAVFLVRLKTSGYPAGFGLRPNNGPDGVGGVGLFRQGLLLLVVPSFNSRDGNSSSFFQKRETSEATVGSKLIRSG